MQSDLDIDLSFIKAVSTLEGQSVQAAPTIYIQGEPRAASCRAFLYYTLYFSHVSKHGGFLDRSSAFQRIYTLTQIPKSS